VEIAIAQSRVAKRGRCEESSIPSAYQAKLHDKHQAWILSLEARGGLKGNELGPLLAGRESPSSVGEGSFSSSGEGSIEGSGSSSSFSSSSEFCGDSSAVAAASAAAALAMETPRGGKAAAQGAAAQGAAQASAPGVLRLDCSKENSAHVVGKWLHAIDNFIAALAQP
jgi:hypothetical protein